MKSEDHHLPTLLDFATLDRNEQQRFIAQMNALLLTSSAVRQRPVEQWEHEVAASRNESAANRKSRQRRGPAAAMR